jgi:predicted outer membrane repeat protein
MNSPFPTHTPLPPTATATSTPRPPTPTPLPADFTVCAEGCDYATIRAAIDAETTLPGAIIEVRDAIHTEAGITVTKDIAIRGLGSSLTTVQAEAGPRQAPDRVFFIPERVTVTLQNMTIRHGKPRKQGDCGGAIRNYGTLVLKSCVVRNNIANDGGGICNDGSLTIIDCSVSHNTADGIAPPGYECGSGGGIKSIKGSLMVTSSTISHNHAEGKGGGIHISCKSTAVLTNITVSGNYAVRNGGGIYERGALTLTHGTIVNNETEADGGGIYVRSSIDFYNSIIANNRGRQDCFLGGPGDYRGQGEIGVNSNNWVGDNSCSPAFSGDPRLGPLEDNGGATQTHALLPDSPAIDAVPAESCLLNIDQRGTPRPGSGSDPSNPCDIGAYER